MSQNPNLTLKMISKNMDKLWDWFWISCNPVITMEMIKDNPKYPWCWFGLSRNPNLTIEMVLNNLDKRWGWNELGGHMFEKDKERFMLIKEHQQFVQEHLHDELLEIAFRPSRVMQYLEMGYNIGDLLVFNQE